MKPPKDVCRTVVCLMIVVLAAWLVVSCGDDSPTSSTSTSTSEFVQVTSLPTTTTWERVWGTPAGEIFLMGEGGVVFRKDGSEWDSLNSGPNFDRVVHSAWGLQHNNLYFVGRITDRGYDTIVDTADDDTIDTTITQTPDLPILKQYNGVNFADEPIGDIDWGLYDIWGSAEDDIYAVGYNGTVIHFDGSAWETQFTGGESPTYLTSVWGSSDSSVFVCGAGGALLRRQPCADSLCWSVIRTGTYYNLWDVWGLSDTSVYMVGTGGTIIRYNGTSMTKMTSSITNSLYSIWGTAANNLYAVGWGGKILHYNGTAWAEEDDITNFGFLSIWGRAADDIYAAGEMVLHYDGTDWSPVSVRPEPNFTDVWAGTDSTYKQVVIVGSGGRILRSAGSNTFYAMTVNGGTVSTDFNGVGGFSDTALFIVGADGDIIMRDEDDFTNWVDVTSGVSSDLYSVAVLSRDLAWAVGAAGTILSWNGTSWTIEFSDTGEDLNDVWITETTTDTLLCIVGDAGAAFWYDGEWHAPATGTSENLVSVTGTSSGHFWAVGDGGSLLHLSNGTWSSVSTGLSTALTSIWTDNAGNLIVSGESGLVFQYTIKSGKVTELATGVGVNLRGVYGFSNANFFVAGDYNHVLHYAP